MFDDPFALIEEIPHAHSAPDLEHLTPETMVDWNYQYEPADMLPATYAPDNSAPITNDATNVWNDVFEIEDGAQMYYAPQETWTPADFDGVGDPIQDAQFWHEQCGQNSCAVVAQISVYESITGQHLPEDQVCQIAQANGWFTPDGGTYPQNTGKILNELGIPTEQQYNATLVDIADALERGDKLIVGLDANEIWTPIRDTTSDQPIEQKDAGHAVWVIGLDEEPDGSVKVILNDSGTPNGQMKVVDARDFCNAWGDYGNFLLVAHPPGASASTIS